MRPLSLLLLLVTLLTVGCQREPERYADARNLLMSMGNARIPPDDAWTPQWLADANRWLAQQEGKPIGVRLLRPTPHSRDVQVWPTANGFRITWHETTYGHPFRVTASVSLANPPPTDMIAEDAPEAAPMYRGKLIQASITEGGTTSLDFQVVDAFVSEEPA